METCWKNFVENKRVGEEYNDEEQMYLYRGKFIHILKRNIENLRDYESYNYDIDYHRASFAVKCKCKICKKYFDFIFWRCPDENILKRYKIYAWDSNSCIGNYASYIDKPIDPDDLYTFLDVMSELYIPIKIKMREPYYCTKDMRVSMSDKYYW